MDALKIDFCGIEFQNPLVLASGILGVTGPSFARTVKKGAGGITTKSVWALPHPGHPSPCMFGTEQYFLNAVGLSDAGFEKACAELGDYLPKRKAPLILNIVGGAATDFLEMAEKIEKLPALPDAVEVNLSCPNVESDFGKPFACDLRAAEKLTKQVRKKIPAHIPLIAKLSPNVQSIAEIARAVEAAGADAICAINSAGPGMRFNIDLRAPILANRTGGVSGPAIFPIAVKAVFDIYAAVKIPILGTGGINSGRDALELMMAGARICGVGTAIYYFGDEFWEMAKNEMCDWLKKENIKNVSEIVGILHQK